jgi:hypothetical protein
MQVFLIVENVFFAQEVNAGTDKKLEILKECMPDKKGI